jgi:hypothetical protein
MFGSILPPDAAPAGRAVGAVDVGAVWLRAAAGPTPGAPARAGTRRTVFAGPRHAVRRRPLALRA